MKWHYFSELDDWCYSHTAGGVKFYETFCGRDIKTVRRHTENKRQVDCLNCLRVLNGETNRRWIARMLARTKDENPSD